MFTEVNAPGRTVAPSTGLVVSAAELGSSTDPADAWSFGFRWRPTTCVGEVGTYDPCGDLGDEPAPPSRDLVEVSPIGFYLVDECSTTPPGVDVDELRRRIEAVSSYVAARELWSGTITREHPYRVDETTTRPNPHLASADAEIVGEGLNVRTAIGRLEREARALRGGQQVMIHVPIDAVAALDGLRRVGNLLLTQTDAIVVADAGYDGSGPTGAAPAAGTVWAYATGPVAVKLGEVQGPMALREELDRRTNRRKARVDRLLGVGFDPCVHLAASIELP